MCFSSLYPRHLCRGVYSFHLFVHPLICSIGLYFRPVCGINSKFYVQPTKWPVCPAKTVHSVVAKSARFFMRTGQMPRLICVSSAHTSFCWFCHAAAHILDEVPSLWCAFLHFAIKYCLMLWKMQKQYWFHTSTVTCTSNRFGVYFKSFAAYIHVHVMLLLFLWYWKFLK